jgi:hypothetical protein
MLFGGLRRGWWRTSICDTTGQVGNPKRIWAERPAPSRAEPGGGRARMTTATTPTRRSAPDYDEIVRVVHLYSGAFGAGDINMFNEAFHEDAWIFFTDAEGNLVRCLISDCFEEWSQPGKANGRVISVTQAETLRMFSSAGTDPTTRRTPMSICTI